MPKSQSRIQPVAPVIETLSFNFMLTFGFPVIEDSLPAGREDLIVCRLIQIGRAVRPITRAAGAG